MAVKNWSTVADDNAFVDGINWQEGQFPSTVNNSAREMMAQIRGDLVLRENMFVNVKDFGAVGGDGDKDTLAFQAALDTGYSLYAPGGVDAYLIEDTLSLAYDGQMLIGSGVGPALPATSSSAGTTLRWVGSGGDFIRLASGRNGQPLSNTVTGLQLRDIKLETAAGSSLDRLIWIEDGVFHSIIEKLHVRGLGAIPSQALIKFESNGGISYPVGVTLRDITLRGQADGNGNPTPIGIWIESAIETYLDRIMIYDCQEGYVLGNSDPNSMRVVTNLVANRCQADLVLGRAGITDAGVGLRIYSAANTTWVGGKFLTGSSSATQTNIRGLKVTGSGSLPTRNVTFLGTQFDGQSRAHYAVEIESTATDVRDLNIDYCELTSFVTGYVTVGAGAYPILNYGRGNTHDGIVQTPRVNLKAQAGVAAAASIGSKAMDNVAVASVNANALTPRISTHTGNIADLIHTCYKSGGASAMVTFFNPTGSSVDRPDGQVLIRHLSDDEIAASVTAAYDPPSIATGAGATTTVAVPSAHMGDFTFAQFIAPNTGNLNGIMLTAYVAADGTIAARFQNETGITRNQPAGQLRVGIIRPNFDFMGSATYDPPSLISGGYAATDVTVTGAVLGDFALASFSNDLQGVVVTAYVSAADTVRVVFYNGTGGTVDLASGTLRAAVLKKGM